MIPGVLVVLDYRQPACSLAWPIRRKGRDVSAEPLIAVIDDDDPFRTALVESLCSFGYRVRGFACAEEFIAANVAPSCDCIITDIHMPDMSGLDLKRHLAAHGSKVPVIMITARAEQELVARAAASGAACLLRKPFESDHLVGWLDKVLKY
jgi:FixJ family two-component response regulator